MQDRVFELSSKYYKILCIIVVSFFIIITSIAFVINGFAINTISLVVISLITLLYTFYVFRLKLSFDGVKQKIKIRRFFTKIIDIHDIKDIKYNGYYHESSNLFRVMNYCKIIIVLKSGKKIAVNRFHTFGISYKHGRYIVKYLKDKLN